MKRKYKVILFLLGLGLAIMGNWPAIVSAYFPANLLLCAIGGAMAGWYGATLILKD